ncbi:hypothetical protein QF037_008267 [Streptomyces canus]|uniref:SpoIIE family protein phosphatase n=1 Tax=Streptomyces canus TaxID=58343 RepID=UPI00278A8FFB|nr:SpoIIE family protein phosphatase [Streptomyces canus]MDQ0603922.1 hypothetical protein [Streptomyces canus]
MARATQGALLRPASATLAGTLVCSHDLDSPRLAAAALAADLDARLAPELGPEDFVTVVLTEFAPGELRLVNCGHPAPLRVGTGLDVLEPGESAPPLGTPFQLLDEAVGALRDPLPERALGALHARLTAHIGRPPPTI